MSSLLGHSTAPYTEGDVGRLARCWSRQAKTFGHARSQRGFRLCGSRYLLNRLEKSVGFSGMAIGWIRQETIRSSSNSVCWLFGIISARVYTLRLLIFMVVYACLMLINLYSLVINLPCLYFVLSIDFMFLYFTLTNK